MGQITSNKKEVLAQIFSFLGAIASEIFDFLPVNAKIHLPLACCFGGSKNPCKLVSHLAWVID